MKLFVKLCQFFGSVAIAATLSNCAVSSPQTRIKERPQFFSALPQKHQDMVQKGEIAEGMHKDAVWIAWGSPEAILAAGQGGQKFDIWRYIGMQPVYRHSIGIGFGGGYYGGRRGRYCADPFYSYDMGPDYIPYTAAEVTFKNDKVTKWERLRR
jgi:hypothetical protein